MNFCAGNSSEKHILSRKPSGNELLKGPKREKFGTRHMGYMPSIFNMTWLLFMESRNDSLMQFEWTL